MAESKDGGKSWVSQRYGSDFPQLYAVAFLDDRRGWAMGQAGSAGQTVQQWLGDFAIPTSIVMCESGGNYNALNPSSGAGGAYQMLPSTYQGLGGKYGSPNTAPKWEQDRLAEKLWAGGNGAGNWECAK